MDTKRPVLVVAPDAADKLLDALAIGALTLLLLLPVARFSELPEQIPTHFNASGEPDDFDKRHLIWVLPAIGLSMFLGFTYMIRHPHQLNYPVKVTADNAGQIYRTGTKLLRFLRMSITLLLAYLVFATIQTALGAQTGAGKWFLPVFLVAMYVPVGYYVYRLLWTK